MAGATVVFAVTGGGGAATNSSIVTSSNGTATVGAWVLGAKTGTNTLTAIYGTLPAVTFTATATAGPPATVTKVAGDSQAVQPGSVVPVSPTVVVKDPHENPVPAVTVTFTVDLGGGSVTGATAITDTAGLARVGKWTLGSAAGANMLSARAGSLPPVAFNATAISFAISSIAPALLLPGATATITGSGFEATPSANSITVDGVLAPIVSASSTQLTFTVPTSLPCSPTHSASIRVMIGGVGTSRPHPLQVAKQRDVSPGHAIMIDPAESRCNELNPTRGRYYLTVSNTNRTYSTSGAAFELRGSTAASGVTSPGIGAYPAARTVTPSGTRPDVRADRRRPFSDLESERLHLKVLESNARLLRENRPQLMAANRRAAFAADPVAPPSVGELRMMRIPDLNSPNICQSYIEITARVAYVGQKSIIMEDTANPLAGQIDSTFASLGFEFDTRMFWILNTSFGNPLAMDAATDNNGRIVMVFTRTVNDRFSNLGGFVVGCDFFPRSTFAQSNFGEHFYARVPTASGNISTNGSPPNWLWTMRSTVIHEAKHITSLAERVSRNASTFETSWLEESTAQISEELFARWYYGATPKTNILYGSSGNPRGPYCEVRPTMSPCAGYPLAMQKHLQGLATGFYLAPAQSSPIGRRDDNDFSFYDTGWALVRWTMDHSSVDEDAFLRALTQEQTLNGVANLEARAGRSFAEIVRHWSLAMIMDDYPGFSQVEPRFSIRSWNLRNIFSGLNTDFPTFFPNVFPLIPEVHSFGSFVVQGQVHPGAISVTELSGTVTGNQAIEFKASGSPLDAPGELRLTIVRIQ